MSTTSETTSLQLLEGSREFFPSLITAIDEAKHVVYIETYIFNIIGTGADIALAIERSAQRGVQTHVMFDGYGTKNWPQEWVSRFQASGVKTYVFAPLGRFGLLIPSQWRRLHRKLCVIDNDIAFCGGINLLDDWYDNSLKKLAAPRLDFGVRVTGLLASDIHDTTSSLWARLNSIKSHVTQLAQNAITASEQRSFRRSTRPDSGHNHAYAMLVLRDNVTHRRQIERAYLKAIGEAKQDIIIANAYFLPGRKLRKALILAAKRGVKVQLLLQGKYEYFMQYHAIKPVYSALLAVGVEIYEYDKSYLHAKVAVIDGSWATVGSSNLDPLSLLLAREANIVMHDVNFAVGLKNRLHSAMQNEGTMVNAKHLLQLPMTQRIRNRIAYALMRLGLWLFGKQY